MYKIIDESGGRELISAVKYMYRRINSSSES